MTVPPALVTRAPAPATMCIAQMAPVACVVTGSVCVPENGATAATWTAYAAPAPTSAAFAPAQGATAPDQMLYMPSPCTWLGIPLMARAEGRTTSPVTWFMGTVAVRMVSAGKIVERDGRS